MPEVWELTETLPVAAEGPRESEISHAQAQHPAEAPALTTAGAASAYAARWPRGCACIAKTTKSGGIPAPLGWWTGRHPVHGGHHPRGPSQAGPRVRGRRGQAARSFIPHAPASRSSKSSLVHDDRLAEVQGSRQPTPGRTSGKHPEEFASARQRNCQREAPPEDIQKKNQHPEDGDELKRWRRAQANAWELDRRNVCRGASLLPATPRELCLRTQLFTPRILTTRRRDIHQQQSPHPARAWPRT